MKQHQTNKQSFSSCQQQINNNQKMRPLSMTVLVASVLLVLVAIQLAIASPVSNELIDKSRKQSQAAILITQQVTNLLEPTQRDFLLQLFSSTSDDDEDEELQAKALDDKILNLRRIKMILMKADKDLSGSEDKKVSNNARLLIESVKLIVDDYGRTLLSKKGVETEPNCTGRKNQEAFLKTLKHFFPNSLEKLEDNANFGEPISEILADGLRTVAVYCLDKLKIKLGKYKNIVIVSGDKSAESLDVLEYAKSIKTIKGKRVSNSLLKKTSVIDGKFNIVGFLPSKKVNEKNYGRKFAKNIKQLEIDCKILITGYTPLFNIYNSYGRLYPDYLADYSENIKRHAFFMHLCNELVDTKISYLNKLKDEINDLAVKVNTEIDEMLNEAKLTHQSDKPSFSAASKFLTEFDINDENNKNSSESPASSSSSLNDDDSGNNNDDKNDKGKPDKAAADNNIEDINETASAISNEVAIIDTRNDISSPSIEDFNETELENLDNKKVNSDDLKARDLMSNNGNDGKKELTTKSLAEFINESAIGGHRWNNDIDFDNQLYGPDLNEAKPDISEEKKISTPASELLESQHFKQQEVENKQQSTETQVSNDKKPLTDETIIEQNLSPTSSHVDDDDSKISTNQPLSVSDIKQEVVDKSSPIDDSLHEQPRTTIPKDLETTTGQSIKDKSHIPKFLDSEEGEAARYLSASSLKPQSESLFTSLTPGQSTTFNLVPGKQIVSIQPSIESNKLLSSIDDLAIEEKKDSKLDKLVDETSKAIDTTTTKDTNDETKLSEVALRYKRHLESDEFYDEYEKDDLKDDNNNNNNLQTNTKSWFSKVKSLWS